MNNEKLHQRIIAGIVLVTLSMAAYAGAVTGHGSGTDRGKACSSAKWAAEHSVPYGKSITSITTCECGEDPNAPSIIRWTCTAEAYYKD